MGAKLTYDAVSRLSSASESETGVWSQSYGYDAFGNRWVSSSTGVPVSSLTPTDANWFDAATNRLVGTNNYDTRGNPKTYGSYTLTYDGEDRLSAASGLTPSTKYEYDGEGRRVLAHSCSGSSTCTPGSGASTTIFVYDAFGRLAMEYRPNTAPAATSYFTQDHLGSTRLETNAAGQQVKCSDYLPFGEEIAAGTGSRPACFNANDNKVKFTGKERDTETGLDYFLARYFSGAQGRFTSPDSLLASAKLADPQSWNRYTYVRNDPVNLVDPDGKFYSWEEWWGGGGWSAEWGGGFGGFRIDGVQVDSNQAMAYLGSGFAFQCPGNICQEINDDEQITQFKIKGNDAGYETLGVTTTAKTFALMNGNVIPIGTNTGNREFDTTIDISTIAKTPLDFVLAGVSLDIAIPGPDDVFIPKWVGWGVAITGAAVVTAVTTYLYKEHTKNARKSTKDKHEKLGSGRRHPPNYEPWREYQKPKPPKPRRNK